MDQLSEIEWTETTWNPVTGCSKVSQGCKHCYAERMAKRLHGMGNPRYLNGFEVTLHDDLVGLPLKWKAPRKIFVNSMSDLLHRRQLGCGHPARSLSRDRRRRRQPRYPSRRTRLRQPGRRAGTPDLPGAVLGDRDAGLPQRSGAHRAHLPP